MLGCACWIAAASSQAGPPTLEQIQGYAFPERLTTASRAPQIAWVVTEHGAGNVWVAGAPDYQPRQLTSYSGDEGEEISSLSLSGDGRWAVYVRGGEHGGNWQSGDPVARLSLPRESEVAIWCVSLAGGPPRRLAAGDYPQISPDDRSVLFPDGEALWSVPIDGSSQPTKLFSARGGVGSPKWSPDGRSLAFVSSRGTHSFIGIYSGGDRAIRWLAPSAALDAMPRWSADGERILFLRRPSDSPIVPSGSPQRWDGRRNLLQEFEPQPWSIWVADVKTGEARRWWASGSRLRDSFLGVLEWAAGGRVVFASYHDGWRHVHSLDGPGREPVLLTPGDFSIEDVLLTPDRAHVVFSGNLGDEPGDIERRHLFATRVDRAAIRPLTKGVGLEWAPVVTTDRRIAFISATARRPPQLALMPLDGGAARLVPWPLATPPFAEDALVEPKSVTFPAEDGVAVHGQIFPPRAGAGAVGSHPAVLFVHGGPGPQQLLGWHRSAYFSRQYALNQYLAQRGFVVLAVNYRTDESYGHDYNFPLDAGARGASDYKDVLAAGRYLQSRSEVDASRIGIYGSSYGGYLVAMALARDSALFKAGVDIHGVHDWVADLELENLFARLPGRLPYDAAGDAQKWLDVAWRSSPVSAVSQWRSPVLLISGDDDRNVRVGQTLDLARRLEKAGVAHEVLILPGETHALLLHANALKAYAATVGFLERYLMPRVQK